MILVLDYLLAPENGAQQQMNDGLCLQEDLAAWGTDVPGQIHCSNVDCPPNWSSGVAHGRFIAKTLLLKSGRVLVR